MMKLELLILGQIKGVLVLGLGFKKGARKIALWSLPLNPNLYIPIAPLNLGNKRQ